MWEGDRREGDSHMKGGQSYALLYHSHGITAKDPQFQNILNSMHVQLNKV